MERVIRVSGVSFHHGFSRLTVDALAANGSLIDTCRFESSTESFDKLFRRVGNKAIRYLRKTYGIVLVEKPSTCTLRRRDH